jgi:hypothetical protein
VTCSQGWSVAWLPSQTTGTTDDQVVADLGGDHVPETRQDIAKLAEVSERTQQTCGIACRSSSTFERCEPHDGGPTRGASVL